MKQTNYHLFDFMDFDPKLEKDEALWKAYSPSKIAERDGDIVVTIPYQRQKHQEDMAPDTSVAPQTYDLTIRAYEPNILRLFTTMTGDELSDESEMLLMAPEVKRVPLHLNDGDIHRLDGTMVASIDLSEPVLDHWSDLLPAPQPAPLITFYPDGDPSKGIALSDDHFSPPRYDALPLGFVTVPEAERATISFRCDPDEHFVGTGERFRKMDLSGQTFQMKNQDGQGVNNRRCYKNIPFYLSSRMYGAFFHTSDYCKLSLADHSTRSVQFLCDRATLDVFLIGGKTPEEILRGYRMLTGFPAMPPLWSFGIWMSRMTYFSAQEVEDICQRLRREHYPCDVIHLDTGWFRTDWLCEWKFNQERFPDPKGFIDRLAAQGFKVSLWQLPYVARGAEQLEEAKANNYIGSPLQTSPRRGGLQKREYNNYQMAHPDRYDILKAYVKENRKKPTEAEDALWQLLRGKSFGVKFRRQHAIGDYIADFACLSCSLVVEVDGGYHLETNQQETDQIRTEYLESKGFSVIRFTNEEVLHDIDQVKARILDALSPSTGGGQGEASNFSALDYAGTIDFTYPKAVDWYKNQLLKPLLDMGVKCIKTDFGENIHMDHRYHAMTPERLNNLYALLYQRAAWESLNPSSPTTDSLTPDSLTPDPSRRGEESIYQQAWKATSEQTGKRTSSEQKGKRTSSEQTEVLTTPLPHTGGAGGGACIWARAAWAGCQRYPVHWGGDSESSWAGMAGSLKGGLHFGLSGFAFWSHDIPGFHSTPNFMNSPIDPQVYVRWTQFGVFSSHMRYHGTCKREPWHYPEIASIVKRWWQLRYHLIPYIIYESEKACRSGLPMIQALLIRHPNDRQVWHIDDEYYFGSEFLVCPLMNSEGRRDIYLPEGLWVNFFTGERLEGGRWHYGFEVPLDEMPVFVRPGATIPIYPDDVDSTDDIDLSKSISIFVNINYKGLYSVLNHL